MWVEDLHADHNHPASTEDSESFRLVSIDGTRVLGAFPSESLELFDKTAAKSVMASVFVVVVMFFVMVYLFVWCGLRFLWTFGDIWFQPLKLCVCV